MRRCHATECVFSVDEEWVDNTGYKYQAGDLSVVIGPFAPRDAWVNKVEQALEQFRLSAAAFEIVERRQLAKPVAPAELIALRVGGQHALFELSIFWPVGEAMWVFRARGPQALEPHCREAAESFVETYQPVTEEEP